MYFGDATQQHTKDPAVVHFGGHYWMYYSQVGDVRAGIGIARSADMEHWDVVGSLGRVGTWESNGVAAPGAVVLDGRLHLFYQSYGNGPRDAILHAWSADGRHFQRDSGPVVQPQGAWTNGRAIDADVLVVGDHLLMYWATRDPSMRRQLIGVSRAPLDSDLGPGAWEQLSVTGPVLAPGVPTADDDPDLDLSWEQDCVEAPATVAHDGWIYLFYGGAYNNAPQQIGVAASRDGLRFRRLLDGRPLLGPGPATAWNASESGHPFVCRDPQGRCHLFYQGDNTALGFPWHIARAEITWAATGSSGAPGYGHTQQPQTVRATPAPSGAPPVPRLTADARGDAGGASLPVLLAGLGSPVLLAGDATTAYRDPALAYHAGVFHLFCTYVEADDDGGVHMYTIQTRSTDLRNWTPPVRLTPGDRNLNYSSPGNVIRYQDQWILCLQTYPRPHGEQYGTQAARIFVMRSTDLEHWSPPELLRVKGPDVDVAEMGRMIDPYLVRDRRDPGKWWCLYKQNGVSMSWSRDLVHWTYAGRVDGGENVCVLTQGDEYVMFHAPANGIGIKRSPDLRTWNDGPLLTLGQEQWPWARGRLTAGFVLDLREDQRVGRYLMVFHGSGPEDERTMMDHHCSIGVAWSEDLHSWYWPGAR